MVKDLILDRVILALPLENFYVPFEQDALSRFESEKFIFCWPFELKIPFRKNESIVITLISLSFLRLDKIICNLLPDVMKSFILALIENEHYSGDNPYQYSSNHEPNVYCFQCFISLVYVAQIIVVCILLELADLLFCEVGRPILYHLFCIEVEFNKVLCCLIPALHDFLFFIQEDWAQRSYVEVRSCKNMT